jgi:ParB-like chromosome segregation protein Spo0J
LGQQNPVKLRKKKGGYQIFSGWSRLRALRELGYITVLAEVYDDLTDLEALLISSSDNLHRAELTDLEISNQLQILYTEYHVPLDTLVDWLGKGKQRLYDLLRLQYLPERGKEAVHAGRLPLYGAIELLRFPLDLRDEYVGKAIDGRWSVRRIKQERKKVEHPFADGYLEGSIFATKGLFHALRYERFPDTENMRRGAWEGVYKGMGVPGPHKCETTITIRALERDPPYVCNNDINWVVVARGRVNPRGGDVDDPGDDLPLWPAWLFLCDECVRMIFPAVEFHEDLPFIVPLLNLYPF